MQALVTTRHEGRLARVTYDNTRRGNSFSNDGLRGLVDALAEAADTTDCSVIRLEMAGSNFSGGWDTTSFGNLSRATTDQVATQLATGQAAVDSITELPVPVVTSVHGKVIGFAAGLLDAVHIAIAADTATMHLPEVRFGFAPAGVGHRLTQALPLKSTYPMLLGSPAASAGDLLRWGLVSAVVPESSADSTADEWARAIAELPGDVARAVLAVVRSSLDTGSPDQAYQISAQTIVTMNETGGTAR
jgi:enoyl-CoA hydratase/carnithine racemase